MKVVVIVSTSLLFLCAGPVSAQPQSDATTKPTPRFAAPLPADVQLATLQQANDLKPTLLELLAAEPKTGSLAVLNLAGRYEELGDATQALELRLKAVEAQPESPRAHSELGLSFLDAGQWDKAESEMKKAVELAPTESQWETNFGYLYLQQKQPAAAIPHYRKAVELSPDEPRLYSELAWAYKTGGEPDKAFETLHEGIRRAPKDIDIRGVLAEAYNDAGKPDEAAAGYKEVLKLDSCNVVASYNMADVLTVAAGKSEEAANQYRDQAIGAWKDYQALVERCQISGQEEYLQDAQNSLRRLMSRTRQ